MSEKKNIDKLFKEQFKDFDASPSDTVWKNIEQELNKDKRKKRIVPIWWKLGGAAAVLALLFTVGTFVFNSNDLDSSETETIVDLDNNSGSKTQSEGTSEKINSKNSTDSQYNSESKVEGQRVSTDKTSDIKITDELVSGNQIKNKNPRQDQTETQSKYTITSSDNSNNLESTKGQNNLGKNTRSANNNKLINTQSASKNSLAQNNQDFSEKEKSGKANSSANAVALNENLSKQTSKSNKNSENTLIDASNAQALISKSKSDSGSAVTDNLNAEQKELLSEKDTVQTVEKLNAIEEAIALANGEKTIEKEEEEKLNRWSVSSNVAPVYFNSLGQEGSSLDNQFAENTKQGQINMSYGVGGSYAINKKLKIRAGINRVDLGYRTNDVLVLDNLSPTASISQPGVVGLAETQARPQQLSNVSVVKAHAANGFISGSELSARSAPNQLLTKDQISLDQSLGFIEVPIEIEYSLVESKFGLNVIGGFSTLFLNNNEIFAVEDGNSSYFGEATNINNMSYSANFGIGFNYDISKQFRFNLEPTFKYQINTFNNTSGEFNPYFIGLYTGLSFKF